MGQERYYTWVGLFVAGALLIITFGAIFIYDQYLQAKVETYVMFFKGSLTGLDTTSIVTYKGVKIGKIRLIELTENPAGTEVEIPVYVDFFVEKKFGTHPNPIKLLIDKGIVANISSANLLTGVSGIKLIMSNAPQKYDLTYYRGYPIFPTKRHVVKASSISDALTAAKKTLKDISDFVHSKEVKDTLESTQKMAHSLDNLALALNKQLPISLLYLNGSLKQFSKTAYSTQNFVDYLSRHPESLIRGKQ